jgi:hypothetical protein
MDHPPAVFKKGSFAALRITGMRRMTGMRGMTRVKVERTTGLEPVTSSLGS